MKPTRALTITTTLVLMLAAAGSTAAQDAGSRPVEDTLYGVSTVIPEGWADVGGGVYTRGTPPEDMALLVVNTAAATPAQLWPGLLPRMGLSDAPEVTGSYSSDVLDWTLHAIEITIPGFESIVEVAMAELDGLTYVLMLQSPLDDYDALREQALVPALEATAPLAPQATPEPSAYEYAIEDVAFPGGAAAVELAGTLTMPDTPGPHPVVITMSGSGPNDRDESLAPLTELRPFAVLADALTSAGVGVLRFDDRGVGDSTGAHDSATVSDFAADAAAAIDYLETRDDVDPARIGLFGHSEGGFYAAMLGACDPRVAFIGMMAPGVTDGATLIRDQNEAMQRAMGRTEEQVQAVVDYTEELIPVILEGDGDRVEEIVLDFYGRFWDLLPEDQQTLAGEREAFQRNASQRELSIYPTTWFRTLLGYDPVPDWEQVQVPVLAVFGGKDVQVVAEPNAAALRTALGAAGNQDVEIITIPDANHLFQEAETGAFTEYQRLEPEFIDGFVDTVVDWMVVHAGVDE